jgi:hypothetical protein
MIAAKFRTATPIYALFNFAVHHERNDFIRRDGQADATGAKYDPQ